MSRVNGLISVAALAAVLFLMGCYNEAGASADGQSDVGGSTSATNPSTTSGTNSGGTGGNGSGAGNGSGGSASSANGGGGMGGSSSTSSAQGGGGDSSSGSGGTAGSGGSTGSGSSSTGSGGAPPLNHHCMTYRYDMPANAVEPDILTIYDQAATANGTLYLRPNPWDATIYGSAYAWGVAVDSQYDFDCSSFGEMFVECTVCRPDFSNVEISVHVQYSDANDPDTRWSCEVGDYFGTFKLWIDGVLTGFSYKPYPAPNGPGCRYFFIVPD